MQSQHHQGKAYEMHNQQNLIKKSMNYLWKTLTELYQTEATNCPWPIFMQIINEFFLEMKNNLTTRKFE